MLPILLLVASPFSEPFEAPRLVKKERHDPAAMLEVCEAALERLIDELGREHATLSILEQQRAGGTAVTRIYLDHEIDVLARRCREMGCYAADLVMTIERISSKALELHIAR